jgi:hypothetical protein
VAQSIERILTVTEQTSQGTRQAAQSIGQLATLARELKASVARFRVGEGDHVSACRCLREMVWLGQRFFAN